MALPVLRSSDTVSRWNPFCEFENLRGVATWSPPADACLGAGDLQANLDDGVLTVRMPKSEAMKPRRIEITGN
jgi:hypothetical protein